MLQIVQKAFALFTTQLVSTSDQGAPWFEGGRPIDGGFSKTLSGSAYSLEKTLGPAYGS